MCVYYEFIVYIFAWRPFDGTYFHNNAQKAKHATIATKGFKTPLKHLAWYATGSASERVGCFILCLDNAIKVHFMVEYLRVKCLAFLVGR